MKNFAHAIAAHRNEVLPQLTADDLVTRNKEGRTLLMEAALAGNTEAVKHLCAMGADVHAADADGNTALHLSAETGGHAAALLLAAGAASKAVNNAGDTPLIHALTSRHAPPVRMLLQAYSAYGIDIGEEEDNDGNRAIIHAMWNCNEVEVKLLLALGADVRECDADGDTPLLLAARFGHVAVARMLLEAGADPNACNQEEKTALLFAVRNHHMEMIDLLLSVGARPDVEDNAGLTPLSRTISEGRFDIATWLVEAGADVSVRFPMKQFDTLFRYEILEKSGSELRMCREAMKKLKSLYQDLKHTYHRYYQSRGEDSFDYLYLSLLYLRFNFARFLVLRCPALLPPELEEAYYNFVNFNPELYYL